MKKAVICLLIFVLAPFQMRADSGPDRQPIESLQGKVSDCVDQDRRIGVQTYDNRRLQGFVSEARTDDFVLTYAGRATTLGSRDVRRMKWPSPVWRQVKVVAGAAAVAGALFGLVVLLGGLRG